MYISLPGGYNSLPGGYIVYISLPGGYFSLPGGRNSLPEAIKASREAI